MTIGSGEGGGVLNILSLRVLTGAVGIVSLSLNASGASLLPLFGGDCGGGVRVTSLSRGDGNANEFKDDVLSDMDGEGGVNDVDGTGDTIRDIRDTERGL